MSIIKSVVYIAPSPSTAVAITMVDGTIWHTDTALPSDIEIRQELSNWIAAGKVIKPYVKPLEPVPQTISRRQCAREMLLRQMITGAEALLMTQTGAPPSMVQTIFNSTMSETDKTLAMIDFAADTYERSNPLLIGIMQRTGASVEDIDNFFRNAAKH